MKSLFIRIFCIICLTTSFLGLEGCTQNKLRNADRFFSVRYGFSIRIPNDWEKAEGFVGTAIFARSPVSDAKDKFRENINVTVGPMPKNFTLEDYYQTTLEALAQMKLEFRMISYGKMVIDKTEAKWVKYSYQNRELQLTSKLYVVTKNDAIYAITSAAEKDQFKKFENTFRLIVDSFQFEDFQI